MRRVFLIFILFTGFTYGQVNSAGNKDANSKGAAEKEQPLEDAEEEREEKVLELQQSVKYKKAERKMDDYRGRSQELNEESNSVEQSVQYTSNSTLFKSTKVQATQQRDQRTPTEAQQDRLDNTVDYFEQTAPQSFEYNYYKYAAGNHNTSLEPNLKKAEELRPNNSDVQVQYAAYYMIAGDNKNAVTYLDKLIHSGRLSVSSVDYGEDVLLSMPSNGVLITHGFDDTYGAFYSQQSKDVRKDVTIISLDLLQSEKFRKRLKNKGYNLPTSSVIDVAYLNQFCSMNASKGLAISMTTPKEYFRPMLSDLYPVGLVFEYRKNGVSDNFSTNENLWKNTLKMKVVNTPKDDKAKQLSSNYLPMLMHLRKVYHLNGDNKNLKEVDLVIDKVAAQCRKYEQVQGLKNAY